MKYANWLITTVSGAGIALSAANGLAQVTTPRRETRRIPVIDANANTTFRSSQLIGTNITDADGRTIGKIVDFVSDSRGNIQYPIISYSGSSGFTGKLFAIPYSGLNFAAGENNTTTARFSFDPALFKNAPSFTSSQFPNFSDQTYLNELKAYYSEVLDRRIAKDPTVPANGPGDRVQTQDQAGTPTRPIDPTLPANGPGDRPATVNPALPVTGTQPATTPTPTPTDPRIPGTTGTENAGFPANTTRSTKSVAGSTGSPAGSAIPGGTVVGTTGSPAPASSFAPVPRTGVRADASGGAAAERLLLRSSQMVGMSIQDKSGQTIGKVVDYVGDTNGNSQFAVVSLTGDDRNIVVPFHALHFQGGAKGSNFASLRLPPGLLKNAPSFTGSEWPNFMDSRFTTQVSTFYSDLLPTPGTSRGYDYGRFPPTSPDGTKYPRGTAPTAPGTAPAKPAPATGPRLPAPGSGAPGVPGVPRLPRGTGPDASGPKVPAPGTAPGGAPGVPGGGVPGGAPGAAPGGAAPRGK